MCYPTPVQPKIGTDKIIQRYTHSTWFFDALRKWFQRLTSAQSEIFAKIPLYTTLAQPVFWRSQKMISEAYICTTWNLCEDTIVYHTRTTCFLTLSENDFRGLHLHNLKSLRRYHCTPHSHNLTFTTSVKIDFRILHLHKVKSLSTIWFYTTFAQPGFNDICTTWFQGSTLAQREIFISNGKVTYFTLHPHILIFITFAKHHFRGFFILVVCMFSYIYIFRTYIFV